MSLGTACPWYREIEVRGPWGRDAAVCPNGALPFGYVSLHGDGSFFPSWDKNITVLPMREEGSKFCLLIHARRGSRGQERSVRETSTRSLIRHIGDLGFWRKRERPCGKGYLLQERPRILGTLGEYVRGRE